MIYKRKLDAYKAKCSCNGSYSYSPLFVLPSEKTNDGILVVEVIQILPRILLCPLREHFLSKKEIVILH